MPRRRPGAVLPLELRILEIGLELQDERDGFYGFRLSKRLTETGGDARMIAHGTLYKALARLSEAGMVEASWEDPSVAEDAGRPRRRLYRVTGAGAEAVDQAASLARTRAAQGAVAMKPLNGLA